MRLDELERELRAERAEADPEFARRLDEWADARFPRGGWPGGNRARGGELDPRRGAPARRPHALRDRALGAWERISGLPPRRLLAPAGSAAIMIVVIGVAISQGGESQPSGETPFSSEPSGDAAGGAIQPGGDDSAAATEPAGGARAAGPSRSAERRSRDLAQAPSPTVAPAPPDVLPIPPPPGGGGGIAPGRDRRLIDATASLVLGAEAADVQGVANGVIEVTDRHRGVVGDSQVASDEAGARASFRLEIPFKRLDAALADLSALADVISRTEAGRDITAQAVRAQRRLAETLADVQRARERLISEDDPERRRILRSQIRFLEAQAEQYEAQRAGVGRRARFATVSVEVTSAAPAGDDGDWSLGEAADDALDVLSAIGGILLISLAILVPLGILVAIAWLAFSTVRRRGRERALDRE